MVDQRTIATAFADLQTRLEDQMDPVVACHPDTAPTVQRAIDQLSRVLPVPRLVIDRYIPPGDVLLWPDYSPYDGPGGASSAAAAG